MLDITVKEEQAHLTVILQEIGDRCIHVICPAFLEEEVTDQLVRLELDFSHTLAGVVNPPSADFETAMNSFRHPVYDQTTQIQLGSDGTSPPAASAVDPTHIQ